MPHSIDTSLVTAAALIKNLKRELPQLGSTVVFNYSNQIPSALKSTSAETFLNAKATRLNKQTTLLSNFGFGSAMLAFYFELALLVGVKEFYILGQAGALEGTGNRPAEFRHGEFIRPASAVCAHSAGHEYHNEKIFNRKSHKDAAQDKMNAKEACIWSTDALFRETARAVDANYDLGARAVEMETSTLFALGNHFNVPVTSYLVISDLVSAQNGWQPGFADIAPACKLLVEAVCSAL